MKVVINKCYGGFGISKEALLLGRKLSKNPMWGGPSLLGEKYDDGSEVDHVWESYGRDIERTDQILVKVVQRLRAKANGKFSKLGIAEIPDGIKYEIEEYDGIEWVAEKHRTWG
jgi:hypothetical protein